MNTHKLNKKRFLKHIMVNADVVSQQNDPLNKKFFFYIQNKMLLLSLPCKIVPEKLWYAVIWPLNCAKCLVFQFVKLQKWIFVTSQIAFSLSIWIADIKIFAKKDNSAFYSNIWHWLYVCLKFRFITVPMSLSKYLFDYKNFTIQILVEYFAKESYF